MKVQWFVGDLLDMVIWSFDLVLFVSERNVLGFGIDHIRRGMFVQIACQAVVGGGPFILFTFIFIFLAVPFDLYVFGAGKWVHLCKNLLFALYFQLINI